MKYSTKSIDSEVPNVSLPDRSLWSRFGKRHAPTLSGDHRERFVDAQPRLLENGVETNLDPAGMSACATYSHQSIGRSLAVAAQNGVGISDRYPLSPINSRASKWDSAANFANSAFSFEVIFGGITIFSRTN
jgi:hypothetical protein